MHTLIRGAPPPESSLSHTVGKRNEGLVCFEGKRSRLDGNKKPILCVCVDFNNSRDRERGSSLKLVNFQGKIEEKGVMEGEMVG